MTGCSLQNQEIALQQMIATSVSIVDVSEVSAFHHLPLLTFHHVINYLVIFYKMLALTKCVLSQFDTKSWFDNSRPSKGRKKESDNPAMVQ